MSVLYGVAVSHEEDLVGCFRDRFVRDLRPVLQNVGDSNTVNTCIGYCKTRGKLVDCSPSKTLPTPWLLVTSKLANLCF